MSSFSNSASFKSLKRTCLVMQYGSVVCECTKDSSVYPVSHLGKMKCASVSQLTLVLTGERDCPVTEHFSGLDLA